ncbi:ATP-binding cassette domain-containing protein [Actinosynnema sp. NPDC020468]|uniref:ATP-binding cassette domain-containing protein n=1 Tax=Actinosynnema sp. NPDC020468 TaxID=3154488 RepID=UPI0033D55F5D
MDVPGAPSAKKPGRGPLGALPALSRSARRALALCGFLALLTAVCLVGQAVSLASVLVGRGSFWALGGFVVARALLAWATEAVAARAAVGAKQELRAALLDRSLRLGPEWIGGRGAAALSVVAVKGLDALDAYFTRYLPALVTALVVPFSVGLWVLFTDPTSAFLVAVTVPLIPVFAILIGRFTQGRVEASASSLERLSTRLAELVRALPLLTAFGRVAGQSEAVRRWGESHRRASMGTLRIAFLSALVLEVVASLSVALVAVGIGLRLVSGELTLFTGLVVLILVPECYLPLRAAGAAHHASEDGVEAVRRVSEVLAEPVPVRSVPVRSSSAAVEVRDLRVRRRGRWAPDGETFLVRPGEIHHLSSPSGSGKSTLFAVLLGYVTPDSGEVRLSGDIAWVPQHPAFAGRTVAEELELTTGRVDREILASVAADHLVDRPITALSTGERQRVAVARALTRVRAGAAVLLLDEPTAHLDPPTASLVMTAIHQAAAEGAAVLLATHRIVQQSPHPTIPTPSLSHVQQSPPPASPPLTLRLTAGALLGALASASGVALTALSAYLIAKASTQPPILTLSVLVVGVRACALGKGVLRYAERLVSHDAAFRYATALRVRLWRGLRPGKAALATLVDDVDTVRDLLPRVYQPPLVAVGVGAAAVALFAAVNPPSAAILAAFLLAGALLAPAVAVLADRRATAALSTGRSTLTEKVTTLLTAAPDLLAFDATRTYRAALTSADTTLTTLARRQAKATGAATAITHLTTGLAALTCIATAPPTLNPLLLPVLALVPLALTEPWSTLPLAAQHRDTLRAAYGRITHPQNRSTTPQSPHPTILTTPTPAPWATTASPPPATLIDPAGPAGPTPATPAGPATPATPAGPVGPVGPSPANPAGPATPTPAAPATQATLSGPAAPTPAAPTPAPIAQTPVAPAPVAQTAAVALPALPLPSSPQGLPIPSLPRSAVGSSGSRAVGSARSHGAAQADCSTILHLDVSTSHTSTPHEDCSTILRLKPVVLDGVVARWEGADRPVLDGVSVEVGAGEWAAVVGASGSGKSSLFGVLLGFVGVDRGTVAVPPAISWAPQEAVTVATTVRENLRIGKPGASDDELREALDLVGLRVGLDAVVGPGLLSGGEALRLGVARALVHDAPLVLLDEPTAHLDPEAADLLLANLERALAGRTVLHVTHRPDEARRADRVIEIAGGRAEPKAYR